MRRELNKNIVGIILAGGLSRRMGQDKSSKKIGGTSLIEIITKRSEKQVGQIIINSNKPRSHFSNLNYDDLVEDCIPGGLGPMAGILTGIKWTRKNTKKKWLCSFPVDSPFFPKDLVLKFLKKSKGSEVLVAEGSGRIHPVFSMWSVNIEMERKIEKSLRDGVRKIYEISKKFKTKVVKFPDIGYDPFFNVNTPKDLEIAYKIQTTFKVN